MNLREAYKNLVDFESAFKEMGFPTNFYSVVDKIKKAKTKKGWSVKYAYDALDECSVDYHGLQMIGFKVTVIENPKHEGFMLTNKEYIELKMTI